MEESVGSLLTGMRREFELGEQDISSYSPLVLAYIGDAVYEVVIRTMLIHQGNQQVQKLHKKATNYVKAAGQAAVTDSIFDMFTEQELAVFKRARNAKQHTTPKNGDIGDYHKATGFEAVVGYLYLTKQEDRMLKLIKLGIEQSFEKQEG